MVPRMMTNLADSAIETTRSDNAPECQGDALGDHVPGCNGIATYEAQNRNCIRYGCWHPMSDACMAEARESKEMSITAARTIR